MSRSLHIWDFLRSRVDADEWAARHRPSHGDDAFHYHSDSISDYLEAARQRVATARTDLGGQDDSWIIEGNSPFLLTPEYGGPKSRAVLMAHGLTDSPFAMRDMAKFFQRRGFHVLAMLLPGHGTRPGDLLSVSWRDWTRAHRQLTNLLAQRFDAVYAFGFSAGAALSIHQSLLNPLIKGLFLFAPALGVSPTARLASPLARLGRRWRQLAWFDVQPDTDCFKYESLPHQGIAEAYAMIRAVRRMSRTGGPGLPLFVVASERDATLNSVATLDWFARQTATRRMLYYTTDSPEVPAFVKCIQVNLPEQRIKSYSHTSLIQSPANPHYGAQGSYRFCTHYYRADRGKYRRCKAGDEDCLGEMFDESDDCQVIRRLTYNPLFEEMLADLGAFIDTAVGV